MVTDTVSTTTTLYSPIGPVAVTGFHLVLLVVVMVTGCELEKGACPVDGRLMSGRVEEQWTDERGT